MKILKAITPGFIALILIAGALIPLPEGDSSPVLAAPLMARTVMTPTAISTAGVSETMYAGVTDGMQFVNNSKTWVRIVNSNGDTITATFVTPRQVGGLDVADLDITVAGSDTRLVGPFPAATYDNAGKIVHIDISPTASATNITFGAFYLQ
jgi:hypothetical protein